MVSAHPAPTGLPSPPTPTAPVPLPARSVALSLLLGADPHRMAPADLIRAGEHVGIAPATMRVALSRASAAGDLVREDGDYVLGPRLRARQRRQDEAVAAVADGSWDGTWSLGVVVATGRPGPERAALRARLSAARYAEVREGTWTRPAMHGPGVADPALTWFRGTPEDDPSALAARLWDLDGWAATGRRLADDLARAVEPAERLAVAAALVRHLADDPLLPAPLLPDDWPGPALRAAYADYRAELRALAVSG